MIGLEELYWYFKLGKPKHKLSVFHLRNDLNSYIKDPVFFLSTGRCGTKWFSELLLKDPKLAVFHDPLPSLAIQGKFSWEQVKKYDFNIPDEPNKALSEIYLAAREQHFRYTAKTGKRYIETNNYITFFAPVLAKIFPDARFVHLVRHPKGFIRSGLDRSYYADNNVNDVKRIIDNGNKNWEDLSRYGKTAWLWNETNEFIEKFGRSVSPDNFIVFPFDLTDISGVKKVLDFMHVDIPDKKIKSLLKVKKNAQNNRIHPLYDQWEDQYKEEVRSICKGQAEKYNFSF